MQSNMAGEEGIIKRMYWQFLDEIDAANGYVEDAIRYRNSRKDLSQMYKTMSKTELEHAEMIIEAVRRLSISGEVSRGVRDMFVEFMDMHLVKAKAMHASFE